MARKPLVASGMLAPLAILHGPAAEPLQLTLQKREMLNLFNRASPNNHVRSAVENGRNKFRNARCVVLIVGIRINDNVGPCPQCSFNADHKGPREPVVVG